MTTADRKNFYLIPTIILFCLIALGTVFWFLKERHAARLPSALNDAELLLSRCGHPDADISTRNDNHGPISARVIEYRRANMRLVFFADVTSPAYQPKFAGVLDLKTHRKISLDEALRRLPCWKK